MKQWPEGLATITVRWDDGSTLKVMRAKVGPDELALSLEDQAEPFLALGGPTTTVKAITTGWFSLNRCEMIPDDEDCFYEIRMGE